MIGKSLFLGIPTKEQNGFPWGQDHGFSYLVIWPSFLKYVSNEASSLCMGWWGLITSSISQHHSYLYTIFWVGEWSHPCFEDINLSEDDLLVTLNLKGILGEVLVWESASLPETISSIGSLTMSPSSPSCDDGKGGALLCIGTPFFCSLMLPHAMAEVSLMHCQPIPSPLDS